MGRTFSGHHCRRSGWRLLRRAQLVLVLWGSSLPGDRFHDLVTGPGAGRSLGGNLVTINDAAEQQWVDDTFDQFGSFWLGLTDEASEGTWLWASGQEVTYTNWISGEPNTTSYDYAYMENGAGGGATTV